MSEAPETLWGFFWTDCIYEGGPVLQSLHRSKRSALRAMIKAQWDRWEAARDNGTPSMIRMSRIDFDYQRHRDLEGYYILPVELLP